MRWSLDQLELFIACAERGSFSAAARHLGRAQSAVSTAIANLELDLDCVLFDRRSRSPTLTAEGEALLPEARSVIAQCQRLNARAQTLALGEEAQLVLAIDEALVEMPPVDATLEALASRYPALSLTLLYGAQGDVAGWVEERTADLGILLSHVRAPGPLEGSRIANLRQHWVVGSTHALARHRNVSPPDLAHHRQLMIASRRRADREPGPAATSAQCWRLNSFYSMAELATRGLGWALIPEHIAHYPPFRQRLVRLASDALGEAPRIEVETVSRRDAGSGPIALWLRRTLGENFRQLDRGPGR
ncbi:LysR family transcriptional regulator [Halomonas sp. V046]|uniref:LysR family transcriptional regulator n=1 Tax=Halomonas sp. V046 TaxID=3459611 RepID=UPI0040448470